MKLQPTTDKYYTSFGILTKPPVKKIYYPNCWNEIQEGKYKDCTFTIYRNYIDGRKGSTLIIYKKFGNWVKSKLKYIFNGEQRTMWSYAKNDRVV